MGRLSFSLLVFGLSAAMSGCGGATPSAPQIARNAAAGIRDAAHQDLMYVTAADQNAVYVLSYPRGELQSTLTGFATPGGECVDGKGDVFVPNFDGASIVEYAHGGTAPIATLSDPGEKPSGCAVNPATGDLAVTNFSGTGSSQNGNVAIYKGASGAPTSYSAANIASYYYCGYDDAGNLLVDGTMGSSIAFAELRKGSSDFTPITMDETFSYAGSIQWTGRDFSIGWGGGAGGFVIYRVSISGSTGMTKGSSQIHGLHDLSMGREFWIEGHTLLDRYGRHVGFWQYPKSRLVVRHTRQSQTGYDYVDGVLVSHGRRQ